MPLKKFNQDTPEPTTPAQPRSQFDPFNPVEDARKSVLGERVYEEGQTQMSPVEAKALIDSMIREAESGFDDAEKVIAAYGKAATRPTDANVNNYIAAMDTILGDPKKTRAVLSILVAVTSSHYRKGR